MRLLRPRIGPGFSCKNKMAEPRKESSAHKACHSGRPPLPRIGHLHITGGPVKSIFCGIETVSCIIGISTDHVYEMVDSGRYLWVWNVSSGIGSRRELRFWSREINDPASVTNLTLPDVIKAVIPNRSKVPGQYNGLRNWEFRHLLRLSKPILCVMRQELGIRGTDRSLFIPRANLEQFFRRRWLGSLSNNKRKVRLN